MRASATSRIASAQLHASQNKPDTNKADEASPFAILMQETAPKDAAKTSHKETSSEDKPAHDSRAVKTDNKQDTSDTNQAQAKPVQTAKAGKPDEKTDDKTVKAEETDAAAQAADVAVNPDQAVAPQPQPVNPQIQQAAEPKIAPAPANDDEAGADEIAAASEVQNNKASQPAQANAPTAPATASENPAGEAQAEAAQAPADKSLTAKPAAKPAKTDGAKTADGKTDGAKPAKASTDNQTAANTTDTKADAANAALNDKAAATQDMAVSRQAHADANHPTVDALTSPQAQQQSAQAAPMTQQVTQHVQVTAQPAPNLPALAVEIAAKSQSGAKQFDIRLDPPELGRVEVRLSIDATGKASAHLSADHPQTLDLLQKDAPALTRALREAGLDVSQDGLNFSLRHQGSQDSGAHNGGSRGAARSFNLSATTSIDATATSAATRSVADGRLDIRV